MADAVAELMVRIGADTSGLKQGLSEAQDGVQSTAESLSNLEDKSGEAGEAADGLGGKLSELFDVSKGFSDVILDMASGLAVATVAMKAIETVTEDFKEGLTKTMDVENARITMTAFAGSAYLAKEALEGIEQLEQSTPFAFPDLYAAERTLLAMGTNTDDLSHDMKMLTDVAAGLGIPVQSLADIFARIQSVGVASSREITQMARDGIPIWQELTNQTGLTGEELKKYVASGSVTFDMIKTAFEDMTGAQGKFYEMAQKQEDTLRGSQDQLKKSTEDFFTMVADGTAGPMKAVNQELAESITDLKVSLQEIGSFFDSIGAGAEKVISVLLGMKNSTREVQDNAKAMADTWAQMDAQGKAYLEAHKVAVKADSVNTQALAQADKDILDKLRAELETDDVQRLKDEEKAKEDEYTKSLNLGSDLNTAIVELQQHLADQIAEIEAKSANADYESAVKAENEKIKAQQALAKQNITELEQMKKDAQKGIEDGLKKQTEDDKKAQEVTKGGWKSVYDQLSTDTRNWGQISATVVNAMAPAFSSAFGTIGKDLATLSFSWGDLKKAGLNAVAAVVQALGEQLMAAAALNLFPVPPGIPNPGAAAGDIAGATAAFVAAGAIPAFASGTNFAPGGMALVGERGPELVNLPRGSQVYNNSQTQQMLGGNSASYHVTINNPSQPSPAELSRQLRRTMRTMAFQAGALR